MFGHFAVCQGLGTRQSDHLASHEQKVRCVPRPGTRRTDHCSPCAREKAHGEPINFAVRQRTGHTAKNSAAGPRVTKFAVCLSRWHTAKSEISPCAYFLAHGEVFCHAVRPSSRHQCLFFLPCTLGYTRRMCLPCARYMAHGKLGLCRA